MTAARVNVTLGVAVKGNITKDSIAERVNEFLEKALESIPEVVEFTVEDVVRKVLFEEDNLREFSR